MKIQIRESSAVKKPKTKFRINIGQPAPTSEFNQLIREALDETERLLKISDGAKA